MDSTRSDPPQQPNNLSNLHLGHDFPVVRCIVHIMQCTTQSYDQLTTGLRASQPTRSQRPSQPQARCRSRGEAGTSASRTPAAERRVRGAAGSRRPRRSPRRRPRALTPRAAAAVTPKELFKLLYNSSRVGKTESQFPSNIQKELSEFKIMFVRGLRPARPPTGGRRLCSPVATPDPPPWRLASHLARLGPAQARQAAFSIGEDSKHSRCAMSVSAW